jgi:hypothetical protein
MLDWPFWLRVVLDMLSNDLPLLAGGYLFSIKFTDLGLVVHRDRIYYCRGTYPSECIPLSFFICIKSSKFRQASKIWLFFFYLVCYVDSLGIGLQIYPWDRFD